MRKTIIATTVALAVSLPLVAQAEITLDQYQPPQEFRAKEAGVVTWDSTVANPNNSSAIKQLGWSNTATVTQAAESGVSGFFADSVVVQIGKENDAVVGQDASDVTALVRQDGKRNDATVNMDGAVSGRSYAHIDQLDNDHTATITSSGSDDVTTVVQRGWGHAADAAVTGDANQTHSLQTGEGNTTGIIVEGDTNITLNNQTGFANTSGIDVLGNENATQVEQGGRENGAWVFVDGNKNDVFTSQWGFSNAADVDVTGRLNTVTIAQDAIGSTSYVTIEGRRNVVRTDQLFAAGSDITVDLLGGSNGNTVFANQYGSLADTIDVDLSASGWNTIYAEQTSAYGLPSAGNLIDVDLSYANENFVAAVQTGLQNTATVDIDGGDLGVVKIHQVGDYNEATTTVN